MRNMGCNNMYAGNAESLVQGEGGCGLCLNWEFGAEVLWVWEGKVQAGDDAAICVRIREGPDQHKGMHGAWCVRLWRAATLSEAEALRCMHVHACFAQTIACVSLACPAPTGCLYLCHWL